MPGQQCREARELLGWTRVKLAMRAGVDVSIIRGVEAGAILESASGGLGLLLIILQIAGVEFTDGHAPGVRLRKVGP